MNLILFCFKGGINMQQANDRVSAEIAVLEDMERRLIEVSYCMKEMQQAGSEEVCSRLKYVQHKLSILKKIKKAKKAKRKKPET
jgi:hypothetical protein